MRQPAPVALHQKARAQAMAVDAGLRREHAKKELLLRHFEAEDADSPSGLRPDVLRHVQRQRGLSNRRPRRHNHEVARLESGSQIVQIRKAGRHAGDQLFALVRALDGLEAGVGERAHRHEPGADAVFGNRENSLLGLV